MALLLRPTLRSRSVATIFFGRRRWRCFSTESSSSSAPQILMEHMTPSDHPDRQITKVTLNRPKANAMGSIMLKELRECLDSLESSSSRCVVLTSSSERVFSGKLIPTKSTANIIGHTQN